MNIKNIFCLSLCLVPILNFADASLNIGLKIQDKEIVIENAIVSKKEKSIFKKENITLKTKILSEDNAEIKLELIISQNGSIISQPTFKLEWEKPVILCITKEDKGNLELDIVATKITK